MGKFIIIRIKNCSASLTQYSKIENKVTMYRETKLKLAAMMSFRFNCKIIGPAIDYMNNDKQCRNNLIRIVTRRSDVSLRNYAGKYFGELFKRTSVYGSGRDEERKVT